MTKLLVDVFTPGNGKTYEFRLDGSIGVEKAVEQIVGSILEAENGAITLDPDAAVLSDTNTGRHLIRGTSLSEAGVKSGHRLVLV